MIRLLELINFQSHKNSNLEFTEGLNIIVGQSDSGKSALLRALRWAIRNKPNKDDFRSWWGGDTSVKLVTTEGEEIERKKTNSKNQYIFGEDTYNAVNKDVPEDIEKALNMNSVNIQEQMDSPFLLSETAGNVAGHFNKVANLQKIDTTLNNIQTGINSLVKNIKFTEEEITEKEEQLEEFIDIAKVEELLNNVEQRKIKADAIETKIDNLDDLIDSLEDTEERIDKAQVLVNVGDKIDQALAKLEEQEKLQKDYKNLRTLSINLHNTNEQIETYKELIKAEEAINSALSLINSREEKENEIDELWELCDNITTVHTKIGKVSTNIGTLDEKYKKILPAICPICNSKIK
jgi:chromosome segregation ATPase